MSNCCPLRPAGYINKQNGGESCKFVNSDFRAFCLKKYTIDREDMLLKLKFNYSSKLLDFVSGNIETLRKTKLTISLWSTH